MLLLYFVGKGNQKNTENMNAREETEKEMDKKATNLLCAARKRISDLLGEGGKEDTNKRATNFLFAAKDLISGLVGEGGKEVTDRKETTLLIAAKNGILEMVEKILRDIPAAIHDTNSENKNILLLAVEYRQPYVIMALEKNAHWNNLVLGVDEEENTVLHLAAMPSNYMTWQIPGSAMQMLWEIKWYQV